MAQLLINRYSKNFSQVILIEKSQKLIAFKSIYFVLVMQEAKSGNGTMGKMINARQYMPCRLYFKAYNGSSSVDA